ncbi:MAG: aspartate 1-decarboxylase [Phycisphaerales bacterium]
MLRDALCAKIHRATVTACEPDYVGSLTVDADLMDACGMRANERVLVADVTSGSRFETYLFRGKRGSGVVCVNGAAARLSGIGHLIIVMTFCHLTPEEFATHRPKVVLPTPENRVGRVIEYAAE